MSRPHGLTIQLYFHCDKMTHVSVYLGNQISSSRVRAQRSAQAAARVASVLPKHVRGVDARSLAAKPPQDFKGHRVDPDKSGLRISRSSHLPPGPGGTRGRGNLRGRGGTRGRGGMRRGAGGGGRGGRGGRGRGRGSEMSSQSSPEDEQYLGFSPEEQAYLDEVEQTQRSLAPITISRGALENLAPGVPLTSTNVGIVDTIRSRMRAVTKQPYNGRRTIYEHWVHYHKGNGTLFRDSEEKAGILGATKGRPVLHTVQTLNKAEQTEILQKFGLGTYEPLKLPTMEDTLGTIDTYTTRNETYLPRDAETLRARVQELLPVSKPPSSSQKPVAR